MLLLKYLLTNHLFMIFSFDPTKGFLMFSGRGMCLKKEIGYLKFSYELYSYELYCINLCICIFKNIFRIHLQSISKNYNWKQCVCLTLNSNRPKYDRLDQIQVSKRLMNAIKVAFNRGVFSTL